MKLVFVFTGQAYPPVQGQAYPPVQGQAYPPVRQQQATTNIAVSYLLRRMS